MYPAEHITPNDIVFLGDSLTEGFDLINHFGKSNLRNRGMSGNLTEHVLYRLEEVFNTKPCMLFLMIGINDIYQGTASDLVINNIEKILNKIQEKSPQTKIYCQSILPVNEDHLLSFENINEKVYKVNIQLREICTNKNIIFIDIHPDFLNQTGQMDSKFTFDGVHLTEEGYIHWTELIREFVSS